MNIEQALRKAREGYSILQHAEGEYEYRLAYKLGQYALEKRAYGRLVNIEQVDEATARFALTGRYHE